MSTSVDDRLAGFREASGDDVEELFGDESICASADHKYRTGVCADRGRVMDSVAATAARETSKNAEV